MKKNLIVLFILLFNVIAYSQKIRQDQVYGLPGVIDSLREGLYGQLVSARDTILTGTATIGTGSYYTTVTHGLGSTPSRENIFLNAEGWTKMSSLKKDNITSTTFQIVLDSMTFGEDPRPLTVSWAIVNAENVNNTIDNLKEKSILDFGNVYNDSTHASTNADAISDAIQYCAENGYVLKIPAGKYLVDAGDYIQVYPNAVIRGDYGKTIFYMLGDGLALQASDANFSSVDSLDRNVYIEGITVIGTHAYGGAIGGQGGIYISPNTINLNRVIIKDCSISKVNGEGIKITRAKVGWVENCSVTNTSFTAYTMLNDNTFIVNNYSDQTNTGIEAYCWNKWLDSDAGSSLNIIGNSIHVKRNYGIRLGGVGTLNVNNNQIIGDTSTWDAGYEAFQLVGSSEYTGTSVDEGATHFANFENNTLENWYIGLKIASGNFEDTLEVLNFKNNTIKNTYLTSFHIVDTSSQNYIQKIIIKDNVVTDWNMLGAGATYAPFYLQGVDSAVVENNKCFKNTAGTKNVVTLINSYGALIRNNDFRQPTAGYVLTDSLSTYKVYLNEGLTQSNGAVYDYQKAEYHKQIFEAGSNSIVLNGESFTLNPSEITAGEYEIDTVYYEGASLGDAVLVSAPYNLQGLIVTAYVLTTDYIVISIFNPYPAWYEYALGSELASTLTWINGVTDPYETFTTSGADISSAINTTANARGRTNNGLSVTIGEQYVISFDITLNSGQSPINIRLRDAEYGNDYNGISPYYTSSNGSNSFIAVITRNGSCGFYLANTSATDFALANLSIKKINMTTTQALNPIDLVSGTWKLRIIK